jgi:hypothetical protein
MAYVNILSQLFTDGNGKLVPIRGLLNADGSVSLDTTATLNGNVTMTSGTYVNVASSPSPAFSVTVPLTVTSGTYGVGDVAGGLITLPNIANANGHRVLVTNVELTGVVALAYNLMFQSADIIAGTIADNGTYSPAAADGANFLGGVAITSDLYMAAASAINKATAKGIGLVLQAGAATRSILAYLVTTVVTSPGTTLLYLTVSGLILD